MMMLTIALALVGGASADDGNLIVNGDFEASANPYFPDVSTGGWEAFEGTELFGWAITNPEGSDFAPRLEVWDHLRGDAYSGDQHIELDSYDPTTISQVTQDSSTTGGWCYELSYAWSPRPSHADNQLEVYVDGDKVAYHSASGSGNSQTSWTPETYQFQATASTTEIAFAEVGFDDRLGMLLDTVRLTECPPIEVMIDIKPGSDPNSINQDSNGVIPVAILTTEDFDAATVDPFTVVLSGASVRVKGKSGNAGSLEDVDGDGDLDLVVQVVNEMTLEEGATMATFTARTYDGVLVTGSDEIRIVPPEE